MPICDMQCFYRFCDVQCLSDGRGISNFKIHKIKTVQLLDMNKFYVIIAIENKPRSPACRFRLSLVHQGVSDRTGTCIMAEAPVRK